MNITSERLANGVVLRLRGRLDTAGAPALDNALQEALDMAVPRIIVDLAKVDSLGSAGARPLLSAYKRVQAEERFLELIRAPAPVRKVLFILGLGDLLPLGEETMQIFDVLKQINPVNEQALRNARRFLLDLFRLLDQDADAAERNAEAIFDICRTYARLADIENELQKLLAGAGLDRRIAAALPTPAAALVGQIAPFVGAGRLLDVGCGAGRVAEAFAKGGREIQLTDIVNHNQTKLPFVPFDGLSLPFPSKAYDICLLISVLHHCEDPLRILREAVRVSRRRIIIREVVYLNEVNRRFNMFFDWFFNCIAPTGRGPAFNINSPEGWEQLFRDEGLSVVASQDLGLDQPTTPEYHWLYVLDIPRP